MVTGHSNKSVDVNALRLLKRLRDNNKSLGGIYRVLPHHFESMFGEPDLVSREDDHHPGDNEGRMTLRSTPNNQPDPLTEPERRCLEAYLNMQLAGVELDMFSLARHIKYRLGVVAQHDRDWSTDDHWAATEHELLKRLALFHERMENWDPEVTAGTPLEQYNPIKNFESQWLDVQKFYLEEARWIFVTASTASSKACRGIGIHVVLIDESSQIKEVDTLNAWARHLPKLGKLGVIGDPKQLGATIPSSEMSEFAAIAQMSLMERLIEAGHPYTMMCEQYRMHPHISHLVNTLVYNGRLIDNPCTWDRDDSLQFYRWALSVGILTPRQALFCNVQNPELYIETDGHSKINPTYLAMVVAIVESMLAFGIDGSKIAIITFYAAQRTCYQKIITSRGAAWEGVRSMSVDGSQGDKSPFVILDPVTPGGLEYGFGFLKSLERLCVALSRARDGPALEDPAVS